MRKTRNKHRNNSTKKRRKIIRGGDDSKTSADAIREILPKKEKGERETLEGKYSFYEAKAITWQTKNKISNKSFFGVDKNGETINYKRVWWQCFIKHKTMPTGIFTDVMTEYIIRRH